MLRHEVEEGLLPCLLPVLAARAPSSSSSPSERPAIAPASAFAARPVEPVYVRRAVFCTGSPRPRLERVASGHQCQPRQACISSSPGRLRSAARSLA
jgi:hypothetical protein